MLFSISHGKTNTNHFLLSKLIFTAAAENGSREKGEHWILNLISMSGRTDVPAQFWCQGNFARQPDLKLFETFALKILQDPIEFYSILL